ncbi:MAG TPA: aminotransferase class I/II-fold pyridoxal phosphate-dependent enzyme [Puia sp.]|jgi:threonine-phosphate decarboxylase|nr:aminotransferase class I/II-fold pyridoxal phosphate-dependent enzyme [Puia sp.]
MLEGHGDDVWKYRNVKANFSSNVLYGQLDEGLRIHLQEQIGTVIHYPEADASSIQAASAAAYGVLADQVLVTNGATEAIYLIAQAFFGGSATIFTPSFAEYEDACRLFGLQVRLQSWETVREDDLFSTDLVFLCNPNNPTGLLFSPDRLKKLMQGNPQSLFVIDESYIGFARTDASLLHFLAENPNMVVLRSLTKSCRIPGLRIGFAVGQAARIPFLRRLKMPWSVNQLALEAASYIFGHPQQFTLDVSSLLEETAGWRRELELATGWRVHPTDTHYFLMETPDAFTAAELKWHLVNKHGLLIRDAANFRGLTPHHFRVACQSPAENQLLTEALYQCSQTGL